MRRGGTWALALSLVLLGGGLWWGTCRETVEYMDGLLAKRTVEDLFTMSGLVAEGVITDTAPSFWVQSPDGTRALYTDYTFRLSDVLRGQAAGETVTLRLPGGRVGTHRQVYTANPELREGEPYLLFLYRPGRGGAYNTAGDYYYILGLNQGVFSPADGEVYRSQSGTELDLEEALEAYGALPVRETYFREEFLQNQKANLESGFITQEEYDRMMAGLDDYAVILEE